MVVYRILPALTSEFVNPDMVPFVLPNVLLIAEECTKDEYVRLILPDLSPVFKQQEPVQVHTHTHTQDAKDTHIQCIPIPSFQAYLLCFLDVCYRDGMVR